MQIIIPMSGFGERFRKAGYDIPKPLIKVEGKPIIQHVVEMFSESDDFLFICNEDHINNKNYDMYNILKKVSPSAKIIIIKAHKLGPVHAVLCAASSINLSKQTVVNYCDFSCYWNFNSFKKFVSDNSCDGAIPAYRGFHPHSIHSNYYAYLNINKSEVIDIQEKRPFTKHPINEYASSGTYYFKSGKLLLEYFNRCVNENLKVNNEFYVSMVYKPMLRDKLNIKFYELEHFMQWGTPEDLYEYNYWSSIFKNSLSKKNYTSHKGYLMMPMAGLGSRFKNQGYKLLKPFIKVSKEPMFAQALKCLPLVDHYRFIYNNDYSSEFSSHLKNNFDKYDFSTHLLKNNTAGQAITCYEGSCNLDKALPITISACDNGMTYASKKFDELFRDNSCDIIVWGAKGYPGAINFPEMYGWIDYENSSKKINKVSVKKPLKNKKNDLIIVGTFTYKKLSYMLDSIKKMKKRKGLINNEYYIDNAINDAIEMGLNCKVLEIDEYICWGTPNDLKTFNYWQACFHKWKGHIYSKENDVNFNQT